MKQQTLALALALASGQLPAPASPFPWPLLTTVSSPGASEPAHPTGGCSRAPVSPHPQGPLAPGDGPALGNVSSLFGVCLEAAPQSLTLRRPTAERQPPDAH